MIWYYIYILIYNYIILYLLIYHIIMYIYIYQSHCIPRGFPHFWIHQVTPCGCGWRCSPGYWWAKRRSPSSTARCPRTCRASSPASTRTMPGRHVAATPLGHWGEANETCGGCSCRWWAQSVLPLQCHTASSIPLGKKKKAEAEIYHQQFLQPRTEHLKFTKSSLNTGSPLPKSLKAKVPWWSPDCPQKI